MEERVVAYNPASGSDEDPDIRCSPRTNPNEDTIACRKIVYGDINVS
jgi:hypothetical protein